MGKRGPGVSQRRLPAAQRKAQRAAEVWDDPKKRKKWLRCVVCDQQFDIGRVKPERRRDYKMTIGDDTFHWCLGCANRSPRRIAQMTYILMRFAGAKCPLRKNEGHSKKTCHTIQCTTRRLVRT